MGARVKLNAAAIRSILKSQQVIAAEHEVADKIAAMATSEGHGRFTTVEQVGEVSARVLVVPGDIHARRAQNKHHILEKYL